MREPVFGAIVLFTGLALGFACGGNGVVDPDGRGGGGAPPTTTTTTTTTTSSMGEGGSGASCPVPIPLGQAIVCGGSGSTGPGGPSQCSTDWCDEGGNIYSASCTSDACSCEYNFQAICNCANDGGGDICAGAAPICCPFPF